MHIGTTMQYVLDKAFKVISMNQGNKYVRSLSTIS